MIYAKIALVIGLFGFGWYCGGLRSRDEMATAQTVQLKALNAQLQSQSVQLQTSEAARQRAVDAYDAIKDAPDPVTVGLAQRVRLAEAPSSCPLPAAGNSTSGAHGAGQEPPGDDRARTIVAANQAVYTACEQDARQLNALEAWVKVR